VGGALQDVGIAMINPMHPLSNSHSATVNKHPPPRTLAQPQARPQAKASRLVRHNAAAAGEDGSAIASGGAVGRVQSVKSRQHSQRTSQRMVHHTRTFVESKKQYPNIVVDGPFGAPCELYLQVSILASSTT
jgi:hypothetical protein